MFYKEGNAMEVIGGYQSKYLNVDRAFDDDAILFSRSNPFT